MDAYVSIMHKINDMLCFCACVPGCLCVSQLHACFFLLLLSSVPTLFAKFVAAKVI